MSANSLIHAGVITDRSGFVRVNDVIKSWVMALNPKIATQYHFQWLSLNDKANIHRWRDEALRRQETVPNPEEIDRMNQLMSKVSVNFRRDACKALIVYDSKTALPVHDFTNDFNENHVVMFDELKSWAAGQGVYFEGWSELDRGGLYRRYCEIHDGVYLWEFLGEFRLPSGAVVRFSDFCFSEAKVDIWRRRFRRYAEFIERGGEMRDYRDGGCCVKLGARGIVADITKAAIRSSAPASSAGAVLRDLKEMHKKMIEKHSVGSAPI